MQYMTTKEAEKKWNISERRIRQLLKEGRVEGVIKVGNNWNIPENALKPVDKRTIKPDNNNFIIDIDENYFQSTLMSRHLPDVDLMIRTSGEQRLSNFMLWQLAYAEFIFTPVCWPDFDEKELHKAIWLYQNRDRRFGGLK